MPRMNTRLTERKKFLLRLPPKLHEELRAWAEDEMRSLNGQIEYVLKQAVIKRHRSVAKKLREESGDDNTD